MYEIELFRKQDLLASAWAGGTTTQIAIYPPQAVYQERNFIWRLSSANVDIEESDFTALPGYKRLLMVLGGEVSLSHHGHHTAHLGQFMQDAFDGSWQTKSRGKCRDFNLIFRPSCRGEIVGETVSRDNPVCVADIGRYFLCQYSRATVAYYCAEGEITIMLGCDEYSLTPGDSLLIHMHTSEKLAPVGISTQVQGPAHYVQAVIQYDA